MTSPTRVHVLTLGCARNEVDSDELAGRLATGGFELVDEPGDAEAVLVNTCGFIDAAKQDSINTLLEASRLKSGGVTKAVVAVGCMAERYGRELADALPEADAVLGFDAYADIATRVDAILHGAKPEAHVPRDRRELLPLTPVARPRAAVGVEVPGHAPASGPILIRRRLGSGPMAPLKIASGCDRRCAFCAIPRFRGSYLSRPVEEIVNEARWLVNEGVKEVFLVSENTSSYGKDLGDPRALETLLRGLADVDGLEWVRLSYLQPAEVKPSLLETMFSTAKVLPYFDLPFQHASASVLRRMRRFGDPDSFLALIEKIRSYDPQAGIRSNVIVGFPGETEADVDTLKDFLVAARLDVVGVFAYSDEETTEAVDLDGHVDDDEIESRRETVADLALMLNEERATERVGESVQALVESYEDDTWTGRTAQQGPDDGVTRVSGEARALAVGDIVTCVVTDSEGIDLTAVPGEL
ncbi:MAG TPA: 30S ribosomal protein S12 methylthiotransferase RimO [Propionibacteriaceae bacterium]|nr:30S ribosomal protein S12 methylthiotransferase RimO [Propionibacteriaceae bacterium]